MSLETCNDLSEINCQTLFNTKTAFPQKLKNLALPIFTFSKRNFKILSKYAWIMTPFHVPKFEKGTVLVQSFEKHRFLHNSALQGHFGEIPPILTFGALESRILY